MSGRGANVLDSASGKPLSAFENGLYVPGWDCSLGFAWLTGLSYFNEPCQGPTNNANLGLWGSFGLLVPYKVKIFANTKR